MDKLVNGRRERKDMMRNLERVLTAANELFAERGNGVTMEEVARRAGVGVGTVYRRFPSKEHLFAAVSHAVCDDTRDSLKQAVASVPDVAGKLHALARIMYTRSRLQAALLDSALTLSPTCATTAEQRELYAEVFRLVSVVLAEGQEQGVCAPGDLAVRAALCTELLTPRVFHQLAQCTNGDIETMADYVVRFMLEGIASERPC